MQHLLIFSLFWKKRASLQEFEVSAAYRDGLMWQIVHLTPDMQFWQCLVGMKYIACLT